MVQLIAGIVAFLVTGVIFYSLLPRGGQRHRWVDTDWEPYISVAICGGIALSFTLTLSGVLTLIG